MKLGSAQMQLPPAPAWRCHRARDSIPWAANPRPGFSSSLRDCSVRLVINSKGFIFSVFVTPSPVSCVFSGYLCFPFSAGDCSDTTHYCVFVKHLGLCSLGLYKQRCCASCQEG